MRRSTLDTAVAFADADCLVPHRRGTDGPEPAPFPYPNPEDNPSFSFFSAAGGILSSVNEMTAYLDALMSGGRARGATLLRPESVAQMQSLQIATGQGHYAKEGYGFGLAITPGFLGHTLVSHGGSVSVSTAHLAFVPERRVGVVMMGNGSGLAYGPVAETVLALMLGHDPAVALPANAIRARMARLVGDYAIYRGLETTKVTLRGGMLFMGSDGAGTPLIPDDPRLGSLRFHTLRDGLRSPVEFLVGDDGSVRLVAERYVYHKR
jgi:CubicO group peptidase (beta-lactamase class C family)